MSFRSPRRIIVAVVALSMLGVIGFGRFGSSSSLAEQAALFISSPSNIQLAALRPAAVRRFSVDASTTSSVDIAKSGSPWLNLREGRSMGTEYLGTESGISMMERGSLRPAALASADVNADGYADLISGFSDGEGRGILTIRQANKQAFEPTDEAVLAGLRNGVFPPSFEKDATVIDLPISPDHIVSGRFSKNSPVDLIIASRHSHSIYVLRSDDNGGFGAAQELRIGGEVTAISAGDLNFSKGLTGVVLGLRNEVGYQIAVFDGSESIFATRPRRIEHSSEITSLHLASTGGTTPTKDLYVLAGGGLSAISNIDKTLSDPTPIELPFLVQDFAIGEFIRDRQARMEIAALSDAGDVVYLKNGELDERPFTEKEIRAYIEKNGRGRSPKGGAKRESSELSPAMWTIAETNALGINNLTQKGSGAAFLKKAHITGNDTDDVLVIDPTQNRAQIFFKEPFSQNDGASFTGGTRDQSLVFSGSPVAVLPTRLNVMGQQGIVVIESGKIEPTYLMMAPNATFNVTKTADTNDGSCDLGDCSLREAVVAANAAAGADMITFGVNGTFQLTIAGANENASATGDLDVTQALTVIGAGTSNTIVTAGTNMTNGIDKVWSVNPSFTQAFASSFSGMTMRFGRNPSPFSGDGFGGGLDWDGVATGTISMSNVNVDQNTALEGDGGGLVFTTGSGSTGATLTNVNVTSNVASRAVGSPGGGIFVGFNTPFTCTTVTINNNQTTHGSGGGLFMFQSPSSTFTGMTVTNNSAPGITGQDGGGIFTNRGLTFNPPTNISNNLTGREGGGLAMNVSMTSVNLSEAIIANNTANGVGGGAPVFGGGGISIGSQTVANGNVVNVSYSRIVGNTAPKGNGVYTRGGAINAENNWWGCNGGPIAPCNVAFIETDPSIVVAGATLDTNPWLRFTHAASPNSINVGQNSTLSVSFLSNSASQAIAGSNLDAFAGFTPTYNNAVRGTISSPQSFSNGVSTATFTGTSAGAGSADATVNSSTVTANLTINAAPTTTTITSDNPDFSVVGQTITVAYTVTSGAGAPTGTVTVSDGVNSCMGTVAAGSCNVALTTVGNSTLTATYVPDTGNFTGSFDTEPHLVNKANTTTTITAESADPTIQGEVFTVFYTVTVNSPGAGTPTGTVTVSDGVNSCMGPVAAGLCSLALNTAGVRTLTATYGSDSNFNGSVSAGEPHTVAPLDTTPPDTSITANPTDPSGPNVSFSFTGTDAESGVASFECSLDGGAFTACTSPKTYTGLTQGSHTFQVRAIDNATNVDPTPASFTWIVDATPPGTTIDTFPPNPSNSANASFTFSGADTGGSTVASFECDLNGGGFTACTSAKSYTGLSDGSHTFMVRAIDGVGNVDASPASYTWVVDTTAPNTSISANPTDPSGSSSASFSFNGTDTGGSGVASFECQLGGGGFTACTSAKSYTGLADGSHTFQVRAIDNAGNADATPASFTWIVDTAPPDTSITANPTDPSGPNVSFSFTGSDAGSGVASFECDLDGGGFAACTSPKTYTGLAQGSHTFQVRAIDNVNNTDPTPASFTWIVDATAPDTTIGTTPPNPSGSGNASFSFSGMDTGGSTVASFECDLDGGGFTACASAKSYTGLGDGSHTFMVRAIDGVGNVEASPASYTWVIDLTAPNTSITANPTDPSGADVSFSFTGTDTGGTGVASFQCDLDGGGFTACTSAKSYTGLSDGSHTFQVRAIDNVGNVDATPASFTWIVDTMPPDTTITANPTDPSGANVNFSFSGSDAGSGVASFECDLDGGGFAACTSSKSYTGLSQGSHTFQVRAIDNVNNTDPTPASFTWIVDATAPGTTIDTTPPDPSGSGNASFTFSGVDTGGSTVASFECDLDGGGFTACTSAKSYTGLSDGSHTFMVRAIDGVGNVDASPASHTWVVDTTGPDTLITANPTDPSNSSSASFSFTGTDTGGTGVASFECQLDGGGYTACTSPKSYTGLSDGSHTFQVRAVDNAGNTDASPASYTWVIDTAPPDTSITANPPITTNSTSASFSFTGTDTGTGVASFECKLDAGAFAACTSSKNYAGLADGSHTFQVRAVDGIGNADPTPASYTWTVDTDPPDVTINQAAGQSDPANGMGITIHFTAVFNEPVTGFTNGDVTLGGTAGATTVVVTQIAPMNGTTYDVAVSGMTMGGTVTASIGANKATDAAGNGNTASTSTDNTVTYVPNTPPTANPDAYSTTQDTPLTVPAPGVLGNDSDPDAGNTITAVLVSGPTNAASFTLNADGSFSYTPTAGFTGTDTFTYKARDNFNADSNTVTVTLSVKFKFGWVSNSGSGYFGTFTEQGLNQVTAGSDVPVRFTLYGNKGNPYSSPPTSQQINCSTQAPIGAATVINRYAPDPFYSSLYDFYQTTWRTPSNWKFTCRRLTLHLNDGTTRSLNFYFK